MADNANVIKGLEQFKADFKPFCGINADWKKVDDAINLLKEQDWVRCSDRMPEEHDSIFAKLKGTDKWRSSMFEKSSDDVRIVEVFEDGTRRVHHSHTIDGKWDIGSRPIKRTVTHWMPNPELPLDDVISLLKEQEPKPVIQERQCEVEPNVWERKGFCPKCHQIVLWSANRLFCGFCGQAVKWDENP